MKKLDPLCSIPAVPNSIAGQWLAFSHMANHYRKLLNVKPRVNSAAVLNPTPSATQNRLAPSLSSYLKGDHLLAKKSTTKPCYGESCPKPQPCSCKVPKKVVKRPPECHDYPTSDSSPRHRPQTSDKAKQRVTNKSMKNRSKKESKTFSESQGSLFNNYHTLFEPSSLKSSTDCSVLSDCDFSHQSQSSPEEPRVETMGVVEKIKVFLDNLHHFDGNVATKSRTSRPKMKSTLKNKPGSCCSRCGSTQKPAESPPPTPVMKSRESRHANCFIPVSLSPMGTPKTGKRPTPVSTPRKMVKIPLSEAISKAKPKMVPSTTDKKKSIKQKDAPGTDKIQSFGNDKKKRYLSGASTGSVGTIRGSEELSTEVILSTQRKLGNRHDGDGHNEEYQQVPTRDLVTSERARNTSRTRTPSAGYSSLMSSSATGSGKQVKVPPVAALPIKNKDSSRDSAYYGFSSGESRITTRESTPEKLAKSGKKQFTSSGKRSLGDRGKCRNKPILSTVPSSSSNFESLDKHNPNESRKSRLSTDDQYLNFLTEVTEDIVNRGIYTNRGLKMLFKHHLDGHMELSVERMTEMLEKLRMDLGIPKDDTLNKLEFGYGSVLNPTNEAYSRRSSPKTPSNPSQTRRPDLDPAFTEEFLPPPPQRAPSQNPFFISEQDSESEIEIELHSCKSETSLSESELQRTLKEVGVDSQTTLEIVSMIKHNPSDSFPNTGSIIRGKQSRDPNSSSDDNDQEHQGHKKQSTNNSIKRSRKSCSTPPTSHCSTTSS